LTNADHYDPIEGKYKINFKVTGFDRDPLTSLIIEAKKKKLINPDEYQSLNNSPLNHNNYAWSLMNEKSFVDRHNQMMDAVNKSE